MKRLRTSWTITAILAGAVASAATGQEAPVEPTSHPLLWRIEGIRPSYLYGTVHVADRRVLALPDPVIEAIEACRVLYTETPMERDTRRVDPQDLLLRPGQTLQTLLPADLRDRLDRYLQSKGLSLERFEQLKPWAMALQATMLERSKGATGGKPLDRHIVELAEAQGKRLDALETVREQIGIFESLTPTEQLDWLRDTLERLETESAEGANPSERLIQLYLAGDPDTIYCHLIDKLPGEGELGAKLTARLIQKRNVLMGKRIEDKLSTDPARGHFFAVGAGHLGGPAGLLALLRDAGFRLRRIDGPSKKAPDDDASASARVRELEALVGTLRAEIRQLKARIRELEKQR